MKKKLTIVICALIVLSVLLIGFVTVRIEAATCSVGGSTCTGQCCKVIKNYCVAGPCSVIL